MGVFITAAELLGRLTVLTPLLERYVGGSRAVSHSVEQVQQSLEQLGKAQSETNLSLESTFKDQQLRLARLEDSMARVSNRLAEMSNDRQKLEADFRKLNGFLRIALTLGGTLLVAILAAIILLILKSR